MSGKVKTIKSENHSLMHYICLSGPGGVERHYLEFVNEVASQHSDWQQTLLSTGGAVHPYIKSAINEKIIIKHEKMTGSFRLPRYPEWFRRWNMQSIIGETNPELSVIWNRPARSDRFLKLLKQRKWLYWEHGAAWQLDYADKKTNFYQAVPFVIANSKAALRVLQLQWDVQAPIEVCLNALRPSLKPTRVSPKTITSERRLKIGMASRLVPIKGGPLALHALGELEKSGIDAELHIAGDGNLRVDLEKLADKLNIADRVIWRGLVNDMSSFYRDMDMLIHPALNDSFGLIGIEAAAFGCPVITTAIDGLSEAVRDGETGYCIRPELPLKHYTEFGGSAEGVPAYVYDPFSDQLIEPVFVDPKQIAKQIVRLANDPECYQKLSRGGIESIDKYYDFAEHVNKVVGIFATCEAQ